MPEAPVHEDHGVAGRKDQVWFAGQVFAVQPKAIPQGVKCLANDYFRFGVFRPNRRHHPASLFWRSPVQPILLV
jgi:hypothetical protein